MDSMILPQVHLTYPAEGLDLGHAEQSLHPVLLSTTPQALRANPSSRDYLSEADYILSPQRLHHWDPLPFSL
jgi:hypothetical protein